MLRDTAIPLNASVNNPFEERRQRWTTHRNLRTWCESWSKDIVELGFGEVVDGKVIILDDQRRRILNLDERFLALDGNKGK